MHLLAAVLLRGDGWAGAGLEALREVAAKRRGLGSLSAGAISDMTLVAHCPLAAIVAFALESFLLEAEVALTEARVGAATARRCGASCTCKGTIDGDCLLKSKGKRRHLSARAWLDGRQPLCVDSQGTCGRVIWSASPTSLSYSGQLFPPETENGGQVSTEGASTFPEKSRVLPFALQL